MPDIGSDRSNDVRSGGLIALSTEKLQVKIGGMSCSFCTETIRKAYSRIDGIEDVHVSLSHEEALIQYNPEGVTPTELKDTLRDLGYTVRDPNKVRSFEEEEAEVGKERNRLILAGLFTAVALGLMVAMWLGYRHPSFRWIMMGLALTIVFGIGWNILKMAYHSLRRRILNQHVLLEFAAFAGLTGGFIGFFRVTTQNDLE